MRTCIHCLIHTYSVLIHMCGQCPGNNVVGLMKMGTTVPRASLEPTYLAFRARGVPLHHVGFPHVAHLSMQLLASEVSADYYPYIHTNRVLMKRSVLMHTYGHCIGTFIQWISIHIPVVSWYTHTYILAVSTTIDEFSVLTHSSKRGTETYM